jgi:hypothetical protein
VERSGISDVFCVHKKVSTYNFNFLIYINLKKIGFKTFIRRNLMNARNKQSDTKSVIEGKNGNLHGFSFFPVPFCSITSKKMITLPEGLIWASGRW